MTAEGVGMEKFIIVGIFLILLVGCTSQSASTQGVASAPAPNAVKSTQGIGTSTTQAAQDSSLSSSSQGPASGPTTYTMSDVSKHNSASNCWAVVNGKVYDITSYVSSGRHPAPLDVYCGTDASTAFNQRPGYGMPHPPKANNLMSNFYIGDLRN